MALRSTIDVARAFGCTPHALTRLIRCGKMPSPAVCPCGSGAYLWTQDDVDAAVRAMATDYRTRQHKAQRMVPRAPEVTA